MKGSLSSEECVKHTVAYLSKQPGFPHDYCNVASKYLFDLLVQDGKTVRLQHSYRELGDGHTFVVETLDDGSEIILDPTYAQYDPLYKDGFIGEHFPDKVLEQNRIEQKDFMDKQKDWLDQGVYDNL